jgi:pyrimidine-specific ribonucleoside hydrolase
MDVDTGLDDAVALVLAARLYGPELKLVTCVAGNTDVAHAADNTLRVLAAVGRADVPVVTGSARALVRGPVRGPEVHGATGLGELRLAAAGGPAGAGMTAVASAVASLGTGVTLVATAPLTNIAVMALAFPDLLAGVERIVWMGGSTGGGNVTAEAEFNAYADPEAAHIVLDRLAPLTMVGLNVTHGLRVSRAEAEDLASRSAAGRLVRDLILDPVYQRHATPEGAAVHDAAALVEARFPGRVMATRPMAVRVDLGHGPSYGRTRCDAATEGPIAVGVDPDRVAFLEIVRTALSGPA